MGEISLVLFLLFLYFVMIQRDLASKENKQKRPRGAPKSSLKYSESQRTSPCRFRILPPESHSRTFDVPSSNY